MPFEYSAKLKNGAIQKVYNLNNNAVASKILNPATDWLAQDHLNEYGGTKITTYILNQVLAKELNNPLSNQDKP